MQPITENNLSEEKLEAVAFILKSIAHPTRSAIINLLKNGDRLSVNDLCDKLGGSEQSLTSHHLSTMKLPGVLGSKREGRNIYYFLKLTQVVKVIDCIENCDIHF